MSSSPQPQQPHPEPPMMQQLQLQPMDVLLGRGARIASHPGNQLLRRLVWLHRGEYNDQVTVPRRIQVSQKIVTIITRVGGRFLQAATTKKKKKKKKKRQQSSAAVFYSNSKGDCYGSPPVPLQQLERVHMNRALEKVSQALRERHAKSPQTPQLLQVVQSCLAATTAGDDDSVHNVLIRCLQQQQQQEQQQVEQQVQKKKKKTAKSSHDWRQPPILPRMDTLASLGHYVEPSFPTVPVVACNNHNNQTITAATTTTTTTAANATSTAPATTATTTPTTTTTTTAAGTDDGQVLADLSYYMDWETDDDDDFFFLQGADFLPAVYETTDDMLFWHPDADKHQKEEQHRVDCSPRTVVTRT